MPSGGSRKSSGPAPDPNSYRSQNKDWVYLPAKGYEGPIPAWPFELVTSAELAYWGELWRKPQAVKWAEFGLEAQVAAYVRAFVESITPGAVSGLKTAARQLDNELGISIAAMLSLGWQIASGPVESHPVEVARQTSSGDWLKAVSVDGT